ncbi:MAG TPA: YcnI family protein [Nakamurella sp.]|nr:YcnI family protein [Nakamurella sp.]
MPASARHPRRAGSRLAALALAVALLLAAGAGVASAHVTVNPNSVTAGSYAKLTFRVPTESATASTVSLQVTLPADHPFPSVSVMQLPGWTAKVTKTELDAPVTEGDFKLTEAVTSITWTADDGVGIKPGQFMEFPISVGPVPDVPSMQFPAAQTYSDGSVVKWDQARTAGGPEPEHPAPLLTIAPSGSAASSGAAGPSVTGTAAAPPGSAVTGTAGPDDTARILGVVALVLAALALLVAAAGVRRRAAR